MYNYIDDSRSTEGVKNGQVTEEVEQEAQGLPAQVQRSWPLHGQRQDRLVQIKVTIDIVALKALHHPIEGHVACPHSEIGEWCPDGSDCIQYTPPDSKHAQSVVTRLVCAHCLIGSAGSDRPHWLTDADAGYFDHPVPGRGYCDDLEHRIWPCPTAIALGLT